MKKPAIILAVILAFFTPSLHAQTYELTSPDNTLKFTVYTSPNLAFSVSHNNQPVVQKSEIAMTIDNGVTLGQGAKVQKKTEAQKDEVITPVVAQKTSRIRDHYKALTLTFRGNYSVEFRAYNDGVAYRFATALKKDITVQSELLNLAFPENTTSLFPEEQNLVSHYERTYIPSRLDTMPPTRFCSLPVLMKVNQSVNVLFTEADLYDYAGMFMYGTKGNALKAGFFPYVTEAKPQPGHEDRNEIVKTADFLAKTSGQRTFPWRVMIISDRDAALLESNLVYQLSRPLKLQNTDWIKPGKVAWDWYNALNIYGVDFKSGINTETYKYYIDFASQYGLEYVILDEGWSKSTTDVLAPNPDIDIAELVAYGKSKNVGLILWLLWKPLDEKLAEICKTYKDWGIKGIKVDFMQRIDQYMVNYYERVAAECAKNNLLVDYHGAFKPAGLRRAYPNVISYEGVRGNETNKWSDVVTPEHTTIIPFIRMVAGPMDFTPGSMSNAQEKNYCIAFDRPMSLGTRANQVAMYVVFESPLQMLCDAPTNYYKEKETTAFIAKMPTVWDETKVLHAKIGDYVALARKNGDKWYVGVMTDWMPRELELDFSFLPEGNYTAEIMKDGVNADKFAEDFKMESVPLDRNKKMKIQLAPGGGWVAVISRK